MTPTVETTTLTSATFENLVREILVRLGEDPAREGLLRTPERVHHAFQFLTKGYQQDPDTMLKNALFTVSYDEMVIVKMSRSSAYANITCCLSSVRYTWRTFPTAK